MIIGWSLGGIIGSPIIAALIGADKDYTLGYTVMGIIALMSVIVPIITKMPRPKGDEAKSPAVSAVDELSRVVS
ncbi:hypothetical protein [Cryobacterium serini]|uniref:hypothetical protein n=1 Tax=Cryobacterium serini TaxID=1259201 RepID=UPI001F546ECE|nr:hypothetical protein [Cryobacterium serini]